MSLATSIGSILAVGLAVYQLWYPAPPPRPEIIALPATDTTTDLSIINADVDTVVRDRRFLIFIKVGADYLLDFDIAIRNVREQAMGSCRIEQNYRGSRVIGQGLLRFGNWANWYDGKGTSLHFNLPKDPTFRGQYFSWSPEDRWPLDSLRVRVICEQPVFQISPWYRVDLSSVTWN